MDRAEAGLATAKEAYLACLSNKPERSLLVSLADKTHNAEAVLFDYRDLDDQLWPRFNGGVDGTRWYYDSLAKAFAKMMPGRLSDRLGRASAGFAVCELVVNFSAGTSRPLRESRMDR